MMYNGKNLHADLLRTWPGHRLGYMLLRGHSFGKNHFFPYLQLALAAGLTQIRSYSCNKWNRGTETTKSSKQRA